MSSKNVSAEAAAREEHKIRLGANLRGLIVVVIGAACLVGLSFGAMMMLTSPDGWITKAARSALSNEPTQLSSFLAQEASN